MGTHKLVKVVALELRGFPSEGLQVGDPVVASRNGERSWTREGAERGEAAGAGLHLPLGQAADHQRGRTSRARADEGHSICRAPHIRLQRGERQVQVLKAAGRQSTTARWSRPAERYRQVIRPESTKAYVE